MIIIEKSSTADTRTCDVTKVSKETLLASSRQHIGDVGKAIALFQEMLTNAAVAHDYDKLTAIDHFYSDFQTKFEQQGWWTNHRQIHRHHLNYDDGIPEDVNLIDVLEFIADCVMAGMARAGTVYPLQLKPGLLEKAFENTAKLLQSQVVVNGSQQEDLTIYKQAMDSMAAQMVHPKTTGLEMAKLQLGIKP
jgi:hypothetical protein